MVNVFNNLINSNTSSKSSTEGVSNSNHIGTLAKLASEMQLIEGLQPIRITGSKNIFLQQTPVQLIEAMTGKSHSLSLLNNGPQIDTDLNKVAELELNSKQQVTNLILPTKQNTQLLSAQAQTANTIAQPSPSSIAKNQPQPASETHQTAQGSTKAALTNTMLSSQFDANTTNQATQKSNQTTPQVVSHPISNKNVIQQSVMLASAVQTLQVVGNGQSQTSQSALNAPENAATLQMSTKPSISQDNSVYSAPKLNNKTVLSALAQYTPPTTESVQQNNVVTRVINEGNRQSEGKALSTSNEATFTGSSTQPLAIKQPLTGSQQQSTNILNEQQIAATNRASSSQTFTVTDGQKNFTVQSEKPLAIGSNLQVFVDPKGQLQVIPQSNDNKPTTVSNALSQSLPQQLEGKELTKTIQDLTAVLQNKNTPPAIQKAINELLQSLPTAQELSTPNQVKQSLQSSGMFLESNLLNTAPNLAKDVKLNWLKLHSVVQNTPAQDAEIQNIVTEQIKLTHQALERITSHQLKSLVEQTKIDQTNSPIFIELPVRDKNTTSLVQFQIERDSSQAEKTPKEKRRWLAKLRFDFPETGKFEARVRVKENQAGIIFVAEEKTTERAIRQSFTELKSDLEKKEIELEQLDCFCRSLSEEKVSAPSDRLIDVRT